MTRLTVPRILSASRREPGDLLGLAVIRSLTARTRDGLAAGALLGVVAVLLWPAGRPSVSPLAAEQTS